MLAWLLRATAFVCLFWSAALFAGRDLFSEAGGGGPLFEFVANGLAASQFAFAFLVWRAAGEATPNRTVVYGVLLLLALKVALDLYALLDGLAGTPAVLVLADLVTSLALVTALVEALPRALRGR
ncbi:MAG: hypothetical protein KatS3mg076_2868 [Candidatus Binatia bacterium]|nr:MAG: hypothetical protein KatS3mg076_2868 [Candidatus Binatia bacterium]